MTGFDSYGDGWNGGELTITDGFSSVSVVLVVAGSEESVSIEVTGGFTATGCDYESCVGCTDATACNYDETATNEDGSCVNAEPGLDCDGNCLEGSNVTLTLYDSYGDGGGSVTINGETYILEGGDSADFILCLDLSVCTEVAYASTDSWSYENSWSLSDDSGELASGADESGNVGDCIDGCMDESACNFNADANIEDGPCDYAEMYYDCNSVCVNDTDGDGVCDELEIAGCVVPVLNYF